MPGLALHNFRGFDKKLINFSQVNFLVGENSTGKTSVISIVEILSNPRFYFTGELASEYCDFSAFEDAVSEKSPYTTFALGYFRASYSKTKRGYIDALAFHFENKNGSVSLAHMLFVANGYFIKAVFKLHQIEISVSHALIDGFSKPSQITEELMWGKPKRLAGEQVKRLKYTLKNLPMPSPVISAMNVLGIENLRKEESDPVVRPRINPSLFRPVTWIAPIRQKPNRINIREAKTYTPEGGHIPSIIRRVYGNQKDASLRERLHTYVTDFGKESRLFDGLNVKEYGTSQSSPFEIRVKFDELEHKIANVGYGVSQALPVLVEVAAADNSEAFVIQQPEVHLHPRAQAAFGDFFFQMAASREHMFFIETHSDFLIDRFRLRLSQSKKRVKPSAQLLFFTRNCDMGNSIEKSTILRDGSLGEQLPEAYKQFFFKEEFSLLSIR
jgi:predicted ATPase